MAVAVCRIRENLAKYYGQKSAPPDSKEWEGKPDKGYRSIPYRSSPALA
jgi:hypothetical protein